MEEPTSELVLPFAVIEREAGVAEEFPLEMTLATVLADMEKQREKAGLLRKREETLEFASMLYWPIVVVPWRDDRHLVFDGMGVWSYVISQGRIPDPDPFTAAADAAKDHTTLLALLTARAAYFDAFATVENLPIMGLFIHEEFMRDVLAHMALAKPRQVRGTPMLTPRLSQEHAKSAVGRMREVGITMSKDVEALARARGSLEEAQNRVRAQLSRTREETIQRFGARIEGVRPEVNARVAQLEREREERWVAMQPKLLDLQSHVRKVEADLAGWEQEARRKDNPEAASNAKKKREEARGEWDRARGDVARYQDEMAQTRSNYDRQVQAQWDRIREIERERDAEIARLNQEEQSLIGLVGRVLLGIAGLTRQLEERIRFLEGQGVPATVSGATVVRMPILVGSLTSERGRRLIVYPPMVAKAGKGVLGGIKSTLGGAVLPLEPKTQQFEEIFRGGIEKALAEDASLAAYLGSAGNANNLLHLGNLREMLSKGLREMKAQGWIKDKHERELIKALEHHIQWATRSAPRSGP